jgi:hypothetical protein
MRPLNLNDPDNMMETFMDAIHHMDLDDLAFLLATGKCELEIRTQIAIHLNRRRELNQTIAREWARHDLAIFEFGRPAAIVEGKAWLYSDAVKEEKLMRGKNSIRHGLEADINKMNETSEKYPDVQSYITMLMFSIDVSALDRVSYPKAEIKYEGTHRQGLKKYGTLEDLAGRGRSAISDLLSTYGIVKRFPIKIGRYLGAPIEADFYLLKPSH